MHLEKGSRLGSYQILAPLGAGGMGEVYRARDTSLGRDVAIKILPASYSGDADRLRRFTQEAQAAAALNHPNILAIYQIGQERELTYIVSELLEGETLRERLRPGPLPVRKALDYALQVANGLAAAHDKGIVHRDLKPENIFVTGDGRVKVLDFGLAKLTHEEGSPSADHATMSVATEAGKVMGTVGYMSPEQVRGKPVDARSDLFSFGVILYEMLSGQRAFHGDSSADVLSSILREEPPELAASNRNIPPALQRIVRHCLEKNPQERFQSARDLAFQLADVSSPSSVSAISSPIPLPRSRRRLAALAGSLLLLALAGTGLFLAGRRFSGDFQPTFHRLTFRRGTILTARFASDGKTVVYGAAWDGNKPEVFLATPDSPESRPLGLANTDVYAVSSSGELALSLRNRDPLPPVSGTLERAALMGGAAPRPVMDGVEFADWGENGSLAVTLDTGVGDRLEYPVGTSLYAKEGPIHDIRVSRDGKLVAFWEVEGGKFIVSVVDRQQKRRTLSQGMLKVQGLAWAASGSEIWFAAQAPDSTWGVYGVSLSGKQRLVLRLTGPSRLYDVSPDGSVLLATENREIGIRYSAKSGGERDLSWLDGSLLGDLSPDGSRMLFSETQEAGGSEGSVYLRKTDGSPPVRLGSGVGLSLSPDGNWALALARSRTELHLLPTGVGEPRIVKGNFAGYWGEARWLPGGTRIIFVAIEAKHDPRIYVEDLSGSSARAISPEGVIYGALPSPDGRYVATAISGKGLLLSPAGGSPQPLPGLAPEEIPVAWSADSRSLFVSKLGMTAPVYRMDVASGRRALWKELAPSDRAGVTEVSSIRILPDQSAYAYSYNRVLSQLFTVKGLK
ncbi:MAG TPA: protein kinase [Terriglobales bacterium]|nr:protein kinase [Terriglobales bacterium]